MVKHLLFFAQRRLRLIIVTLFISLMAVWSMFGRMSLSRSYNLSNYTNIIYPLSGKAKLSQDFEANYPGLYRIDLYLTNQKPDNNKLIIHLKKDACNTAVDLETFVLNVAGTTERHIYPVIFSPIDNSARRKFCVVLEGQSEAESTGLGVYGSQIDIYPAGAALYQAAEIAVSQPGQSQVITPTHFVWLPAIYKSNQSREFDIGFGLYYYGPTLKTIPILLTRLADYKPGLFGKSWFYSVLIILYLLILALFFRLVSRAKL